MDMFEKIKSAGESVVDTAKTMGETIISVSKEQGNIAGMKVQKSLLQKKLDESYTIIGKRYVEYMNNSTGEDAFDISDILEGMQADLDKLAEITASLSEKEALAKEEEIRKEKQKIQAEFDNEKEKLDKALEMEIIDEDLYNAKLAVAQKKFDNYEQIKKIKMQLKMGIIDQEEYTAAMDALLK